MLSAAIILILRPFLAFALIACILLPARYAVIKWCPRGWFKRILLTDCTVGKRRH